MDFKLPELGEGVHEGELVKWKIKPGDVVKHDQPLCEVMTDKATIEIPSSFAGKVSAVLSAEGHVVKVGETMLRFEGEGEDISKEALPTTVAAVKRAAGATVAGSPQMILASPATRRIARERGIDLTQIHGSGPQGRILKEDLSGTPLSRPPLIPASRSMRTPLAIPTAGVGEEKRIPLAGLRKKISEKMRLSKDHAVHFTFVEEADATELVKLRAQAKEIGEASGVKVTYLPLIMKAMVEALRQFPLMNASLDEQTQEIVIKNYYNIGLSIQTEEGLTAPVVKGVEHQTILELAQNIQSLVDRARKKQLSREDFQGGTITLTNAGSIGGLFATPVINYPEVAILGFNKIFRKPVVKVINAQEQIVIRDWTYFSISLDHRVVDGAIGAEFMKLFIRYIENPSLLLLNQV